MTGSGVTPTSLSESGGAPIATYASLAAGQTSTIEIGVTLNDPNGLQQVITNRGDVTWTSLPGDETSPDGSNGIAVERTGNTANPGTTANDYADFATASVSANLGVTKTDAPDPVLAGGTLTYSLSVTNAGPAPVANARLTDTLPAGVTYVVGRAVARAAVCTVQAW